MDCKIPKISFKYCCSCCSLETNNKKDYNKHLATAKHMNRINADNLEQKNRNKLFICKQCNKSYTARNSLWYHEKVCQVKKEAQSETNLPIHTIINDNEEFKKFILEVVKNNTELQKQNQELQKKIMEICSINHSSTINNTNNSHNKTFNMQFFLNEQCKDAMNIMDFVDTFKLQFSDLEKVGEVGYVEGISNIIIKKLNEMDIYKRPIHCSDAKRETLYVKDKNVWEKENGNHDRLRLAIKHITKKNTDMLDPWRLKHPGSCDSDNYLNDIYLEMVMQAMGGRGGMEENENKIIKKIAKMVLIDK
jgi:hypothetical protein